MTQSVLQQAAEVVSITRLCIASKMVNRVAANARRATGETLKRTASSVAVAF